MKVHTNAPSTQPAATQKSKTAERAGTPNKIHQSEQPLVNASHSGSSVEISDHARLMQKAMDIALQTPDVRKAQVQALKQSIHDGTYRVDPDAIAERLVEEHLGTDFGKNNL